MIHIHQEIRNQVQHSGAFTHTLKSNPSDPNRLRAFGEHNKSAVNRRNSSRSSRAPTQGGHRGILQADVVRVCVMVATGTSTLVATPCTTVNTRHSNSSRSSNCLFALVRSDLPPPPVSRTPSILEDPVMLPCNHPLCRGCASQCFKESQRCPQCMTPIPNLRMLQGRNKWIVHMVDKLKNSINDVGVSLTQHAPGQSFPLLFAVGARGTAVPRAATVL